MSGMIEGARQIEAEVVGGAEYAVGSCSGLNLQHILRTFCWRSLGITS